MAITIAQICANTEKLYDMHLIAGKNGIDNVVRWVHMVEDIEVPDFLHGNELVFTTGIAHFGNEWLLDFVTGLKKSDASGIVVNIGPYIDSIPSKVIVYCEKNNLPLFTIPWNIHIIDITYELCHRIIENEKKEIVLAESFRNLIFSPENREGYASSLERAGFNKNSDYKIVAANITDCGRHCESKVGSTGYSFIRKTFRKLSKSMCMFIQDGRLIAIVQNASEKETEMFFSSVKNITAQIPDINIVTGISDVHQGYAGVPECYREAVSALCVSHIKKTGIMKYEDIGIYKLLLGIENKQLLKNYVYENLGKLSEHDRLHGTDYESTLRIYLENGGSVQSAAQQTGVHRNTVNYKMKMIREILNVELSDEERTNLRLAFCAQDILNVK